MLMAIARICARTCTHVHLESFTVIGQCAGAWRSASLLSPPPHAAAAVSNNYVPSSMFVAIAGQGHFLQQKEDDHNHTRCAVQSIRMARTCMPHSSFECMVALDAMSGMPALRALHFDELDPLVGRTDASYKFIVCMGEYLHLDVCHNLLQRMHELSLTFGADSSMHQVSSTLVRTTTVTTSPFGDGMDDGSDEQVIRIGNSVVFAVSRMDVDFMSVRCMPMLRVLSVTCGDSPVAVVKMLAFLTALIRCRCDANDDDNDGANRHLQLIRIDVYAMRMPLDLSDAAGSYIVRLRALSHEVVVMHRGRVRGTYPAAGRRHQQ